MSSANWANLEFLFSLKLKINPWVLGTMEFFRIEEMLKQYSDYVEKENKQYEKQKSESEKQYGKQNQQYDANSLGKQSMPNYGGFQVPKVQMPTMPTISYPKL